MALSLLVDYWSAIKTYIEANLQTHINAINAEYANANLTVITTSTLGYVDILNSPVYPVLAIDPGVYNFEEMAAGIDNNRVSASIWIADKFGEKDNARMLHYGSAFLNMLKASFTLGGAVMDARIKEITHYPPAEIGGIGAVEIILEIQKDFNF